MSGEERDKPREKVCVSPHRGDIRTTRRKGTFLSTVLSIILPWFVGGDVDRNSDGAYELYRDGVVDKT